MILITILLLTSISTISYLFIAKPINQIYDIWILLVAFIVFLLIFIFLFLLYFVIYTEIICKSKKIKPSKFSWRFIQRIAELLCQVSRVKLNVRGLEKIPTDKNFFIIQNHLSIFDPISTVWALRYFDFTFILKDTLRKAPFIGNALHRDGHLELDRNNNRKGLTTILKAIDIIVNENRSVFVYPEGTRSKTGELGEFHSGTFKIAEKAKCPIVVSVIINSDKIRKRFYYASTDVYIDVIRVLQYEEYKDMTSTELNEYVHKMMKDRIEELDELKYKTKK